MASCSWKSCSLHDLADSLPQTTGDAHTAPGHSISCFLWRTRRHTVLLSAPKACHGAGPQGMFPGLQVATVHRRGLPEPLDKTLVGTHIWQSPAAGISQGYLGRGQWEGALLGMHRGSSPEGWEAGRRNSPGLPMGEVRGRRRWRRPHRGLI